MLLESVLTGAVRGGTSILYATVGETVTERSGVIGRLVRNEAATVQARHAPIQLPPTTSDTEG